MLEYSAYLQTLTYLYDVYVHFSLIGAQSTYQLSLTQFECDVCKTTLTVIHRLPTGFGNEISPTHAGHNELATVPTRVIQTWTRERVSDTNVGFRPTQ